MVDFQPTKNGAGQSVKGQFYIWRQSDGIYMTLNGVHEPLTFKPGDGQYPILDAELKRIGK
jgi:hypothetical protein